MSSPVQAKDVKPKAVNWLWEERIPRGALTVVAGKPDQGKGLFSAFVTAQVTKRGGRVLYSAIEDDHGLMTRPRLEAAGADLSKITLWRFQLPSHELELRNMVLKNKIDLIVLDPFAAHLSGGVSRFGDNIRQVTTPLSELAEESGAAVLITEHALKRVSEHAHPLNAIGGSGSGLPAAARMAYVFGVDPDDGDRRILAPVKSNLRRAPKSMAFEVDVDEFPVVGEMAFLLKMEELEFDARRLLATNKSQGSVKGRPPDRRAAACEWLTNYLVDKGGKPVRGGAILEDAKQYGMSSNTIRRAADDMGILKNPPSGKNCMWDLPMGLKKIFKLDGSTP